MKGFPISKDYQRLWSLIQKGYRIPAWVVYKKINETEIIYDLVEVKLQYKSTRYNIGTRGSSWGSFSDQYEDFIQDCEVFELQWVDPDQHYTLLTVKKPDPHRNIIGLDADGNQHRCYLYYTGNSDWYEWRCPITGGLMAIEIERWIYDEDDKL